MGKKILLADDSITIQKVIELTFSDEDFEVITVGNGRLAIERIQEVRPDVILCDIIMPEKDGYDVCDFVKNNPSLSHTPVLLLAGAFEPFDQERAARVRSDGFLAKPFEPQTLITRVKELMSRAKPPSDAAVPPETPEIAAAPAPAPPTPPPASAPPTEAVTDSEDYNFIPEEPYPSSAADTVLTKEEEAVPEATLEEEFYSVVETPHEPARRAPELEMVTDYEAGEEPTRPPVSDGLAATPETAPKTPPPVWSEPTEEMSWESRAQASTRAESSVESASSLFEEVFDEELSSAEPTATVEAPVEETVRSSPATSPPLPPAIAAPPIESFADIAPQEASAPPPKSTAAEVAVPTDMVSQIAQRVIGQVSEKIVREIAWEVVPELAETLIKKEIERLKAELKET